MCLSRRYVLNKIGHLLLGLRVWVWRLGAGVSSDVNNVVSLALWLFIIILLSNLLAKDLKSSGLGD